MGAFTASRLLISYLRTRRPADGSGVRPQPSPVNGRTVRPFCHTDVAVASTTPAQLATVRPYRGETMSCSQ
ncbi:MAG: hypothetical protein ACF8TS_18660 [Maioricimonas sp. JB049]